MSKFGARIRRGSLHELNKLARRSVRLIADYNNSAKNDRRAIQIHSGLSFDFLDPAGVAAYGYLHGHMNPERAFQEQIERYRRMTGEQRLAVALQLHELSCNVAREGIRRQNAGADDAEVERLLRERLELARQ
jgi:hypothetical protein